LPDATYVYEVLADKVIYDFTRQAMLQSASILQKMYPDVFTSEQLEDI